MKNVADSSYKKMIEMDKVKDLYDFSSIECRAAVIGTIILDIIFIICSINVGIDEVAVGCVTLLDNIGIALIGFLGFTVSALAILTGAISSKVVKMLKSRDKMAALERILLSFYLMGMVCAVEIMIAFVLHFLVQIPVHSIFIVNIIIMSGMSYMTIFVIFYSVKLIGNCLELFYIVNSFALLDDDKINYKERYNSYRILALEKIQLSESTIEKVEEYKETLKILIKENSASDAEKEILLKMHREHFGEWKHFYNAMYSVRFSKRVVKVSSKTRVNKNAR